MTGLALLLGFTAIVWLIVREYREAEERIDESDWRDWDWPVPDDADDWDFPEREEAA